MPTAAHSTRTAVQSTQAISFALVKLITFHVPAAGTIRHPVYFFASSLASLKGIGQQRVLRIVPTPGTILVRNSLSIYSIIH